MALVDVIAAARLRRHELEGAKEKPGARELLLHAGPTATVWSFDSPARVNLTASQRVA
jgi:hypothetical protein